MPKHNLDKAFGKSNKEIKKLLGLNSKTKPPLRVNEQGYAKPRPIIPKTKPPKRGNR